MLDSVTEYIHLHSDKWMSFYNYFTEKLPDVWKTWTCLCWLRVRKYQHERSFHEFLYIFKFCLL